MNKGNLHRSVNLSYLQNANMRSVARLMLQARHASVKLCAIVLHQAQNYNVPFLALEGVECSGIQFISQMTPLVSFERQDKPD